MAQFSLSNVHKRGLKHHHFIYHLGNKDLICGSITRFAAITLATAHRSTHAIYVDGVIKARYRFHVSLRHGNVIKRVK